MRPVTAVLAGVLAVSPALAADEPAPPSTAQALELARLWLDGQRAYDGVPGLSLAVVHDQETLWSGGLGLADLAAARPATADTLYSICSISKLFTSIGVMQLRDQGKLSLEDPVGKHLSWFRMAAAPEGRAATIRGLLTHSSGLPREADFPYWRGEFDFPTHEEIVERLAAQEALYPSDRYLQYSNLGLTLAGEVVSAVSGEPYDAYVRRAILQPLGMSATFTEVPLAEKGRRLATGYSARRRDGTRATLPIFQTRGIAPAAGFASTAGDLARFAAWQFRALAGKDDAVLDRRTLREMQRPHWVEPDFAAFWGLGFETEKRDDTVFVGHGGSCPGFRSIFMLAPAKKVGVVLLTNASGTDVGRYADAVYDIVAPTLKEKAKEKSTETAASASESTAAAYVGSYDEFPWWGETLVFAWGDGLGMVGLPSADPAKDMAKLRKVGEHTFRRVRKDDTLGETIRFDIGPDGRATRFWRHSNPTPRITTAR
jgi:CubicO group peptidase (beta-lactamase class C family)